MKRFLMISLTACLVISLMAGCAAPAGDQLTPEASQSALPEAALQNAATESSILPPSVEAPAAGVSVAIETLLDVENQRITYPVISGLPDSAAANEINAGFLQQAESIKADLEEGAAVTLDWEIASQSETLLSLVQTGYYDYPQAAHPSSSCSAYNFDPATGKALRLSDLCDTAAIAADLSAALGQQGETAYTVSAPDGTDVFDSVSLEELMQLNAFQPDTDGTADDAAALQAILDAVDTEAGLGNCSYWKDGTLHLVLTYYHAVGDYLDFAIADAHLLAAD